MSNLTDRLGGARTSLAIKAPCRVATTANITLSGFQTIDGVTLASGDANLRVLVKNQTTASENGIYIASSGNWQRARDFDGNGDVVTGTRVIVPNGSTAGGEYEVLTADPIVIGTSSITFAVTNDDFVVENFVRRVDTVAELKALDTSANAAAILTDNALGGTWHFTAGNFASNVAADTNEQRFIEADDTAASSGAWIKFGSAGTGHYAAPDARIWRYADRMFGGNAAAFGGEWGAKGTLTGLDTYARAVHDWAFRDGDLIWDSIAGSMAIVGHSQASKWTTYPGNPSYHPVSIGVSGFSLNDVSGGVGYGGYFDAVRDGGGFTVAAELACANLGAETTPTPWNILTGGIEAGVAVWSQSGCGLDLVYEQYDRAKSIAAHQVYLTSYRPTGGAVYWDLSTAYVVGRVAFDGTNNYCCLSAHTSPSSGTFADYRTANPSHWQLQKTGNWITSTAYVIGDLANDTVSGVTFRCAAAHTSAASGTFAAARAANTTYWKQLPAAKKGRVIAAGGVEEESAGTNLFVADDMPLGHKYRWSDSSAATKAELWGGDLGLVASSFLTNVIYTDSTSAGGPYVQLTRVSATPAASDGIGGTIYAGYNASAAQVNYVSEAAYILDTTAGSEDGEWTIAPMVAGSTPFAIKVGNGVQIGSPTGGYKGTGYLNAVGLYEDGTALDAKYGRLGSANTWTATNTFQLSDNGAALGPTLILDRLSASAAASDGIGTVQYRGRDSGGNATTYGEVYGAILDPTDTTEDSMIGVSVMVAGTYTAAMSIANGVVVGNPTGSFKGTGTLNATAVYDDDVLLTCMPMAPEFFERDEVDLAKWDALVPVDKKTGKRRRKHEAAHLFKRMVDEGFNPKSRRAYFQKMRSDQALPGMPSPATWKHGDLSSGQILSRQWLAIELLAHAVHSLSGDVDALVDSLRQAGRIDPTTATLPETAAAIAAIGDAIRTIQETT